MYLILSEYPGTATHASRSIPDTQEPRRTAIKRITHCRLKSQHRNAPSFQSDPTSRSRSPPLLVDSPPLRSFAAIPVLPPYSVLLSPAATEIGAGRLSLPSRPWGGCCLGIKPQLRGCLPQHFTNLLPLAVKQPLNHNILATAVGKIAVQCP